MAAVSRTTNPLHFEDLEPHRFEDLVRQICYEFKPWRKLEATGRKGADDGFDARGWEIVSEIESQPEPDAPEDEIIESNNDRLWLIQCKREKSIGPTKLVNYLEEIDKRERSTLYGIVFAAPCDFSKKARDAFFVKCKEFGISECHLWGKAELEDVLFQPKNDHLLFAYFGFSLTIRRRSLRTDIRNRLAMKRKAHRILNQGLGTVLLRDPRAREYPYKADIPDFESSPKWRMCEFDSFDHDGPKFLVRRTFAYLADDKKTWDAALAYNHAHHDRDDPWGESINRREIRAEIAALWDPLPDKNKAWMTVYGRIRYEAILDIDELGDDWAEVPHIYVPFENGWPFDGSYGIVRNLSDVEGDSAEIVPTSLTADRIEFFPAHVRK